MTKMIDPFDELAAMFLTAPTPTPTVGGPALPNPPPAPRGNAEPVRQPHGPATAELLIAGNLPVRGALWLTPYADAISRQAGAVALIRLDSEQPSVQVLRGPVELATSPLGASLEEAVAIIAPAIDVWMVVPRANTSGRELLESGGDRITILSSADEAAVVAAYQSMKDLVQAVDAAQVAAENAAGGSKPTTMPPVPPIGLAVVGCDPAAAAGVIERLNRTTVSFLGVEVTLRLALPRMDAGIRSTRFAGFNAAGDLKLAQVMGWIHAAKSVVQPAPQVAGRVYAERDEMVIDAKRILEREPAESAGPAPHPFRRPPQETFQSGPPSISNTGAAPAPRHAPPPAAPPATPDFLGWGSSEKAPRAWTVKLSPKPARLTEPKGNHAPSEPDDGGRPVPLSHYVPGLKPLPFRAPNHERVELAVEASGRVHLLARDSDGDALRAVRIVEAWARLHRELIAMACPQHRLDFALTPLTHVFTSEPASVCDLYRSGVRLHVLAPVNVKGHTGWYAAPLNNER